MKNRAMSGACTAAAVVFATAFAVSAAQAFTLQDSGGASSAQGFLDLDKPTQAPDRMAPVNRFGDAGQTAVKQGNATFQFGNQRSFEQKYNTDNIFNPFTREGR
jgi:hypothetical protein